MADDAVLGAARPVRAKASIFSWAATSIGSCEIWAARNNASPPISGSTVEPPTAATVPFLLVWISMARPVVTIIS